MPPPEPRSNTTSPSCKSATAVGLPQPRLARTASAGSWPSSASSYWDAPRPSASGAVGAAQQSLSMLVPQRWPDSGLVTASAAEA